MGLLCTNNSMGFSLKYDPCPQVLLYHSWESSIPDNLHESYSSKVHTVWLIFSASRAHRPNSTHLVITREVMSFYYTHVTVTKT